ncbi:MAG: hypothetical protein JJ953_13500 [Gracilimonas sp.]|uniref:Uncharacterized protein n=1 Tax=Gracilimonas sediminicola TaxID=2952158 RepID=A0A9X2L1E7_9BACT|nr:MULTISPECIES: hypothetical protein [Gracilimonas]MBO6587119.1 hypothetical protein [Gracilimonas sp.]MBO6614393.1 hypothetical protein [Gracilimonas sp.]MCP9290452.1 hypothetical protein [Gracilimonas sediminicola]
MKYTTVHLGDNKIELFNTLLGKETVKVNGEVVSSTYSMLGAEHTFTVREDGRDVECTIQFGFGMNGVVFDLYKEGTPIIESEQKGCMGMFIVFIIVFSIIFVLSQI